MGQKPQGLKRLMGSPALLRKERGVQVWQYAGQACVLLVYLYENPQGDPEVSYLDARSKSTGAVPVPQCLADIAEARAAGAPAS